ncbi:MAG: hypothetical protein RBU37_06205 [Myxococcota bacterium]|nr:hypothetical protein [Myxococcota bacterium]
MRTRRREPANVGGSPEGSTLPLGRGDQHHRELFRRTFSVTRPSAQSTRKQAKRPIKKKTGQAPNGQEVGLGAG